MEILSMIDAAADFMTPERASLYPRVVDSTGREVMPAVTFDLAVDIKSAEPFDGNDPDAASTPVLLLFVKDEATGSKKNGVKITKFNNYNKTVSTETQTAQGETKWVDQDAFMFEASISFYNMSTVHQADLISILGAEAFRVTKVKFYSSAYHHLFNSSSFRNMRSNCHKSENFDTGSKLWHRLRWVYKNFYAEEPWNEFMGLVDDGQVSLRAEFTIAESAVGFKAPNTATKFAEAMVKSLNDPQQVTLRRLASFFGTAVVPFPWISVKEQGELLLRRAQSMFTMASSASTPKMYLMPAQYIFELMCRGGGFMDRYSRGLTGPAFRLSYKSFKKAGFKSFFLLVWKNKFISDAVKRGDKEEQGINYVASLPTREKMKDMLSVVSCALNLRVPFEIDTASDDQITVALLDRKSKTIELFSKPTSKAVERVIPKADVLEFVTAVDPENLSHLSIHFTPAQLKLERGSLLKAISFAFKHASIRDHRGPEVDGDRTGFVSLIKKDNQVYLKHFPDRMSACIWAVCSCLSKDGASFDSEFMVTPCGRPGCSCGQDEIVDNAPWECGAWTDLAKLIMAHTNPAKMVKKGKASMAFQCIATKQCKRAPWIGDPKSPTNFSFPMRLDPVCIQNPLRFVQCYVEFLSWTSEQPRGRRPDIRNDENKDFNDIKAAFEVMGLWVAGAAGVDNLPVEDDEAGNHLLDSDGDANLEESDSDESSGSSSSSDGDSSHDDENLPEIADSEIEVDDDNDDSDQDSDDLREFAR
jgi:hypothetical protein